MEPDICESLFGEIPNLSKLVVMTPIYQVYKQVSALSTGVKQAKKRCYNPELLKLPCGVNSIIMLMTPGILLASFTQKSTLCNLLYVMNQRLPHLPKES